MMHDWEPRSSVKHSIENGNLILFAVVGRGTIVISESHSECRVTVGQPQTRNGLGDVYAYKTANDLHLSRFIIDNAGCEPQTDGRFVIVIFPPQNIGSIV